LRYRRGKRERGAVEGKGNVELSLGLKVLKNRREKALRRNGGNRCTKEEGTKRADHKSYSGSRHRGSLRSEVTNLAKEKSSRRRGGEWYQPGDETDVRSKLSETVTKTLENAAPPYVDSLKRAGKDLAPPSRTCRAPKGGGKARQRNSDHAATCRQLKVKASPAT